MGTQDLLGLRVLARAGDPHQHLVQPDAGDRRGVEVGLQDLGAFAGVEPGGLVGGLRGGALDGSVRERLRPPFSEHRVLTAVDRVPHQLRGAGGGVERVENRDRPAVALPGLQGEEQILGLREGHQRATGRIEQCGHQQV